MKKVLIGIIIGLIALAVFMLLGGSAYLKKFGRKTEEAGAKMEVYEKKLQQSASDVKEKTVEKVGEAGEKAKEAASETKKKVKEFMPEGEK